LGEIFAKNLESSDQWFLAHAIALGKEVDLTKRMDALT